MFCVGCSGWREAVLCAEGFRCRYDRGCWAFWAEAGGDPKHFFDALAMSERDDRKALPGSLVESLCGMRSADSAATCRRRSAS